MPIGDTLAVFLPLANEPPLSNFATLDVRNAQPVLAFNDSTDEQATFAGVLPRHYAGGGITATLVWCSDSATSGAAVWEVQFERQNSTHDLDADSFASGVSVTEAFSSVDSGKPFYTQIALLSAQMDGLLPGERFRIRVSRLAADASDTMSGDAQLLAVELQEV